MNISLRDYFAATANVSWLHNISADDAALKAGINAPGQGATAQQIANFWIRAEIAWRFRYSDLMLKGKD